MMCGYACAFSVLKSKGLFDIEEMRVRMVDSMRLPLTSRFENILQRHFPGAIWYYVTTIFCCNSWYEIKFANWRIGGWRRGPVRTLNNIKILRINVNNKIVTA
ncbi:hypothetical protein GBA52_015798 [Prunus armeniaca]|nr:hypothetical protein GBA52_015798 [Prunus armeniaca]